MATLLVPLLVVGLVSFALIRSQQGDGSAVIVRQRQTQALTSTSVDQVVSNSPDPIGKETAIAVHCNPVGSGPLRNPWFCVLRYPTGRIFEYRVTISADGSFFGDHQLVVIPGPPHAAGGSISGCCVPVP
jgi:hypothetical protein